MNAAILPATISGIAAIVVAATTYYWTKKRDHEADWRRLKHDHYRTFISKLSGAVRSGSTTEAKADYADAVNALTLVAPPDVLHALYAFHSAFTGPNDGPMRSTDRHEALLSTLLYAIRNDIQPRRIRGDEGLILRLLDVPARKVTESGALPKHHQTVTD